MLFGGLRGRVHHVEGEGEAGGFEVEAVVIDFLSRVRMAVTSVKDRTSAYPDIVINFTRSGEMPDHTSCSFQAALTRFVKPRRSGTLLTFVTASRWILILFHDPISAPSCSEDEEGPECEK